MPPLATNPAKLLPSPVPMPHWGLKPLSARIPDSYLLSLPSLTPPPSRPTAVITRIAQLGSISGSFLSKLVFDIFQGRLKESEVSRAIELRNIVTSLGPAYIKLGQALSIRPDLLSPAAMNELQKLCDKVPSFDSKIAMQVGERGEDWGKRVKLKGCEGVGGGGSWQDCSWESG